MKWVKMAMVKDVANAIRMSLSDNKNLDVK
jgi:hypothetical protein